MLYYLWFLIKFGYSIMQWNEYINLKISRFIVLFLPYASFLFTNINVPIQLQDLDIWLFPSYLVYECFIAVYVAWSQQDLNIQLQKLHQKLQSFVVVLIVACFYACVVFMLIFFFFFKLSENTSWLHTQWQRNDLR